MLIVSKLCLAICWFSFCTTILSDPPPPYLHLTALISNPSDNDKAAFQCWEMSVPFSNYPTVGSAITGLANVSNVSYVVLPPHSKEGLHKPPHPMFFVLLSGLAHVTLPDGEDELWIEAGLNSLVIAADVVGDGHYTEYPSDRESVALQIPFEDGRVPAHRVLREGICDEDLPPVVKSQKQVGEL